MSLARRSTIGHVDGRNVKSTFPSVIDPVQPMMDLRALTHEAAPGLKVTCLMEGDTYEMEDQRNWTDASYKTYVRPLALPWPYTLPKGEKLDQAVTLDGHAGKMQGAASESAIAVTAGLGADSGVPCRALGAGLDPDDIDSAVQQAPTLLSQLGLDHVICHHDPRRGHDATTLQRQVAAAKAIGATPWLEAVITSVDDCERMRLPLWAPSSRRLGSPFATVLVSPAPGYEMYACPAASGRHARL